MFKVGQKVVCVKLPRKSRGKIVDLVLNKVYTIESFYCCKKCGVSTLFLLEKRDVCFLYCGDCKNKTDEREHYRAKLFRPLDEVSRELTEEILESIKEPELV